MLGQDFWEFELNFVFGQVMGADAFQPWGRNLLSSDAVLQFWSILIGLSLSCNNEGR